MKKLTESSGFCALVTLLCLMVIQCTVSAVDKREAIAYRAVGPIVIDGDLAEWNTTSPLALVEQSQVIRDADFWGGPLDLSAKIYVMWDRENLYLGADVAEDTPFRAATILPFDLQDSFEVYLSTNPEADPNRESYESTDFRVLLLIDNDYWDTAIDRTMVADPKGFHSRGISGGESVLSGFECAVRQTTLGFTYEAVIPWRNFASAQIPPFVPEPGDRIGFDFVITDTQYPCPGEEYIPQISWSGDSRCVRNPSVWGVLVFE